VVAEGGLRPSTGRDITKLCHAFGEGLSHTAVPGTISHSQREFVMPQKPRIHYSTTPKNKDHAVLSLGLRMPNIAQDLKNPDCTVNRWIESKLASIWISATVRTPRYQVVVGVSLAPSDFIYVRMVIR
jgi:hypothetical protein